MSKLIAALRKLPKSSIGIIAVIAAAVLVPAALLAWGPDRPTYTMEHPADHPTFDSITDNPNYGDEREFTTIKDVTAGSGLTNTAKLLPGHEYQVQIYIHNNAASELNASGKAIAKDVMVRAQLPASVNGKDTVDGFISSSNATPNLIWDSADLTSDSNVNLQFESGSAMLHTNSQQTQLSDNVITTGVKVGDSDLSGIWHGCLQYAGAVTFKIKVAGTPNFTFTKEVSKHGANQWVKSYTAQPGETVDYLLEYKNTGTIQQDNVVIKDQLPAGMTYVTGSTVLGNALHPQGIATNDGVTTSNGINVGNYGPGGNAWVIFSAKAPANDQLQCNMNTLHNVAEADTVNGGKSDSADVTISKTCQPTPKYTCDALTVTQIDRTHFSFDTKYTVENATFKNVQYTVRDSNGKVISQSTDNTYTQDQPGNYTVQATVTVTVNGQDQTATSDNCTKPFTVTPPNMVQVCNPATGQIITVNESDQGKYKPVGDVACQPSTPTTPTTPTQLPHTGASDGIVAFVGLGSLVAAIAYYVASRRALIG